MAKRRGHPGFDVADYPGDALLHAWKNDPAFPFEWVGYYLEAPFHHAPNFTPWSGHHASLRALGLGLAVVYVGLQEGSPNFSAARGAVDARDAAAKLAHDGLPASSVVFLDVEPPKIKFSDAQLAYVKAWITTTLQTNGLKPGIYCHIKNSVQLRSLGKDAFTAAGKKGEPPIWVAGGSGFSLDKAPGEARFDGKTFDFVAVWQGELDTPHAFGGKKLTIDSNVALAPNPSNVP